MSNTAAEVASDIIAAIELSPMRGTKEFSTVREDEHGDRAKVTLMLKSNERFLITVEKIR